MTTLVAAEPQLYVSDVAASATFYTDTLGFAIAFLYGEPPFYGQVSRDGARLNLRQVDRPVVDPVRRDAEQLLAASVTLDDAEPLFREYEAAGAEFAQPLRTEPWGARTFVVRDPDGNLVLFAGHGWQPPALGSAGHRLAEGPSVRAEFPSAVPEIPVRDLATAAAYYQHCLGFTLDWDGDALGLAGVSRGRCRLFLANPRYREAYGNPGPTLTWLNVESREEVDALYHAWNASGAMLLSAPASTPWGLHEFTAADPDGNRFRVFYDVATPEGAGET